MGRPQPSALISAWVDIVRKGREQGRPLHGRLAPTPCPDGKFPVRGQMEAVNEYIARQEEHHRKVSFQDELLSFLRKQGIAPDERYIYLEIGDPFSYALRGL